MPHCIHVELYPNPSHLSIEKCLPSAYQEKRRIPNKGLDFLRIPIYPCADLRKIADSPTEKRLRKGGKKHAETEH